MTPTQEQLDIIHTFDNTRVLKVNAVAGAGKTSTLVLLAEHNTKPSLYVCFNKVIQEEASAKFPSHVSCRTTHSLAFSNFGRLLQSKRAVIQGEKYKNKCRTSLEVARFFSIQDFETGEEPIKNTVTASLVRKTVDQFCCSVDTQIEIKHVPFYEIKELRKKYPNLDFRVFLKEVVKFAKKLWNERINPNSDVVHTDDTYLKMWQLSNPVLNYDIIYVDEAQDSNPCVLDVIQKQTHAKILYVGDTYQSIYQFRGAVNAMQEIVAPVKNLSKSFRYGDTIASVAKTIINGEIDVKGNNLIQSSLDDIPDQESFTFIFRTNSELINTAINLLEDGEDIYVQINTKDFCNQLISAESLMYGQLNKVKHDSISSFQSWYDLLEASKEDPELQRVIKIIKDGDVTRYINQLDNVKSSSTARIILTTAHKSKGKEWRNVMIADDFPFDDESGDPFKKMPEQERNLLYVACTRATHILDLPPKFNNYFRSQDE